MSSRLLSDCRPEFADLATKWLAACLAEGLDILVYCTLRSIAEQDALFQQGRTLPGRVVTNAIGGQSAHNFGLALDHVPLLNGKAQWAAGNALYVHSIHIAMGCGLESLAGSRFPEWCHLQMPGWKAISELTKV